MKDHGEERTHGADTLRVWHGTVVGVHGDDVFVELGPRMQGVISAREFEERPREGDEFDFTLRGQEQGLWVLARREARTLATWEEIEVGSLVSARVTGRNPGGLELKVGPLHAFMPRGQTGLPRGEKLTVLVGRTLTCEVIEVDDERQRVLLSRKLVLERERESRLQRLVGSLRPGQVVHGRVTRIEPYGAFVSLGRGLMGLVHVSDLSVERVTDPHEVVKRGDHVSVKILSIKQGGKRIGLGMKQLAENPWRTLERFLEPGQIVTGIVSRLAPFGAFVLVQKGVEGLVHLSETGLADGRRIAEILSVGSRVSVRVLSLDVERERLSLSLLHENGTRVAPGEADDESYFREFLAEHGEDESGARSDLGRLLRRALEEPEPPNAGDSPESR